MSLRIAITLSALLISMPLLGACEPAKAPLAAAPTAHASLDAEAADQAAYQAAANQQPTDPVDAFIWRAELCLHLGGEISGDRSPEDAAVMARMDALKCGDELVADGRALRAAHASDAAATARIDKTLADIG